MPTMAVPDPAKEQEFIIESSTNPAKEAENVKEEAPAEKPRRKRKPSMAEEVQAEKDEFDLSDITHQQQEKSREDIIAEAEAQAFAES